MGVNIWDRFGSWSQGKKLEEGFEEGASIAIKLDSGDVVPAEVRVFKSTGTNDDEENAPQTGLRALINGQSHAKRDAHFFRTKAVDLEHIAGSILVTLDCSDLGQDLRNSLFMSNRETFREDPLLSELLNKLQKELRNHEGLGQLNLKRYEEKIKNAVNDEFGISALEELLSSDPTLADLFGSELKGKVAAKTIADEHGSLTPGTPEPFKGVDFPTFIHRRDKGTSVEIAVPRGNSARISFLTDVKNNYFSRVKHRGTCVFEGDFEPTFHLFNGRLTFTCQTSKKQEVGSQLSTKVVVTDNKGSGPFELCLKLSIAPEEIPVEAVEKRPTPPKPPTVQTGPSRPDIKEMDKGPDEPPLKIEKVPGTERLQLVLNTTSKLLDEAKKLRSKEEEPAVSFVFKYGLALTAMGLLDAIKKTDEWDSEEAECRSKIEESVKGIARVIVPLCLSLPKKLPKPKN